MVEGPGQVICDKPRSIVETAHRDQGAHAPARSQLYVFAGFLLLTGVPSKAYNRALMSERLPVRVQPYRLAAQGRRLTGTIKLSGAARLSASLAVEPDEARVRLAFYVDASGRPTVEGEITADLTLICQRCLEPVTLPVISRLHAALVGSDAEAARLQSRSDILLVEEDRLTLLDLVEDELLLALPLVPMHPGLEACAPAAREALGGSDRAAGTEERPNPFAVLKDLKFN